MADLLGLLVDRHVPLGLFGLLGAVRKALPLLATIGVKLPPLPGDLPQSGVELKDYIRRELYAQPVAKLVQILQLAEATTGAWLAEYEASLTPATALTAPTSQHTEDSNGRHADPTDPTE